MKSTILTSFIALVVIGTLFLASSVSAAACCVVPCDREEPLCQPSCGLVTNKNSCSPYASCAPAACGLGAMDASLVVDATKVTTIKAKAVVKKDGVEA